jgi:Mycothiol maleylpyruvate isomerase N-terminal domain
MTTGIRELFVESARAVRDAIADDVVRDAWGSASVLDEQTVGGIAGHLARGGVWVVGGYLDMAVSDAPRVETAVEYYVQIDSGLTPDDHRAIRERGAQIAALGHSEVCETLTARLDELAPRVFAEPADRVLPVVGGALTIGLDEYLKTRIVEQVVHLDDLARSIDRDPWPVPEAAQELVVHLGIDIARVREGNTAVVRALYRSRLDPVLPVL